MNDEEKIKRIIEGLLLAAGKPLKLERIAEIFHEDERPDNEVLLAALKAIEEDCSGRGFELSKVASGYRFQVRQELSDWVSRLWEEKPQKYSRALLETLAIIAYRQPITRGDIEKIRGVAVSSSIVRTLLDREWVRVVGHRDVPGRPAMYASTRQFLDYFDLDSLNQLPALTEIRDLEDLDKELPLEEDLPEGRLIEYPEELEDDEEMVMDEDEAAAAAIGTRSMNEILGIKEEENEDQMTIDDAVDDPEVVLEQGSEEVAAEILEDESNAEEEMDHESDTANTEEVFDDTSDQTSAETNDETTEEEIDETKDGSDLTF